MITKYNIPSQIQDWDDLNRQYSQAEIVEMCDQYLRSRVRGKFTRAGQKTRVSAADQFFKTPEGKEFARLNNITLNGPKG